MAFVAGIVICALGGLVPLAASIMLFVEWKRLHDAKSDEGVENEILNLAISLLSIGFVAFIIGVAFFFSKKIEATQGVRAADAGFKAAAAAYRGQ
jgi:cell division protein FtsX